MDTKHSWGRFIHQWRTAKLFKCVERRNSALQAIEYVIAKFGQENSKTDDQLRVHGEH
ncbi:hypothetical protein D918_05298 [Trichuris suis]|nr:hypothetical protein D918_05298 [Trichuris suis]